MTRSLYKTPNSDVCVLHTIISYIQYAVSQLGPYRQKVYKSALQIEGWWIRMKNRKVFKVLKDAVCAAVSVTYPPPHTHSLVLARP